MLLASFYQVRDADIKVRLNHRLDKKLVKD